jgi:hypothetical protein
MSGGPTLNDLVSTMWQTFIARAIHTLQRVIIALRPLLQRLGDNVRAAWHRLLPLLRRALVSARAFVRGPLRRAAILVAQTVAALLLLFYEWGWRPLADLLAKLSAFPLFARLEAWIKGLAPYPALALFAAPAVCLFPLKLFALYLFATGHPLLGVGLIAGAKIVGTAFVARIFVLTQPQLMQIAWFKAFHNRFIPWKDAMFAKIRASSVWRNGRIVRVAVKRTVNRTWIGLKPQREKVARAIARVRVDIKAFLGGLGRDIH